MFLAFVFMTLTAVLIGIAQLALHNNMQRNLAPAEAYAQNITQWHQAAMLLANDTDADFTNGNTPKADCRTTAWGGTTTADSPCTLIIPKTTITTAVTAISPGYQRMEDWQSWYYRVSTSEAYVITLYTNPTTTDPGYLKPGYVAEGLKRNMGYDRSGVGVISGCATAKLAAPNETRDCLVQFNPLVQADVPLQIAVPSFQSTGANFTSNNLLNGAGLMTRVQ